MTFGRLSFILQDISKNDRSSIKDWQVERSEIPIAERIGKGRKASGAKRSPDSEARREKQKVRQKGRKAGGAKRSPDSEARRERQEVLFGFINTVS